MSWDFIKGIASKTEISVKRCLRLDGVNDYLSLGNSSFYNVGLGEFTFAFKILKYTGKQYQSIYRSADEAAGGVNRISINIENTILRLASVNIVGGLQKVDALEYNLGNIIGNWITIIVIRKGTNYAPSTDTVNYPNSIRNPDNYHVYLNGVELVRTTTTLINSDGMFYLLDNDKPKILGGITNVSDYYFNGYYDLFGYWNRAISSVEIANINNNILDDYQAKGIFIFDGNTLDSSSAQGTMTLINSATPPQITYPYKDGVIPFLRLTSNQVKQFKYAENVIITKIWKEQSSYNGFRYSFDNSTWSSIPDGGLVDVYIVVPANTILYIKDPTSRTNYNVLHLDFE